MADAAISFAKDFLAGGGRSGYFQNCSRTDRENQTAASGENHHLDFS